jgi:putative ABC transport system substrate-binding protein
MKRRQFLRVCATAGITTLATSVSSPMLEAAEPTRKAARVGFIYSGSPDSVTRGVPAFWKRLNQLGWVEGRNLTVEARWAEGHVDRLPALAREIVSRKVDVIVTYTTPGAAAAKDATTTIPIVCSSMGDPVGTGLVSSLARPGGNLTGLSSEIAEDMSGKWLELLREIVPRLSEVAVISNPDSLFARKIAEHLKGAAPKLALRLRFIDVRNTAALDRALRQMRPDAQAILVVPDPLTIHRRKQIANIAARRRLPDLYGLLDLMDAGGLMAYGSDQTVQWERAAVYVDKVLRGANPADLPIEQPTQIGLVVNLKTARTLGLTIPESILLRADQIIR